MKCLHRFAPAIGISVSAVAFAAISFAQPVTPRFESSPCSIKPPAVPDTIRLECGHLVVAQDRARPTGKQFRLAVAIVRFYPRSSSPPLVLLHGGPSGPGGINSGEMSAAINWAPKLKRDIIVYDQRGVGLSEPKLCQTLDTGRSRVLNARTQKERQDIYDAFARECVANLKANDIDPDMFNSEVNAADLIDLRKSLGYLKWDIAGVSYGGRLVQEALRRDPKGIRSVVMHSPSIVAAGAESDGPLSYQRAVERVIAACRAQPSCSAAFPTFEQDFFAVYQELNQKPFDVTVERGDRTENIRFDGERFLRSLRNSFGARVKRLPLLVRELKSGDRMRAARILLLGAAEGSVNNVLTDLVGCYDGYGPDYLKRIEFIATQVRPEFRSFVNDLQECRLWHSRFAAPADRELVRSDIPALILTAEFDDRTPTVHGQRIASGLKTAYVFELPGQGHGQAPFGCPETIVIQFLENPMRKPDASCIASMPAVAFETKMLESPTINLNIASSGEGSSQFVGKWEAFFPNAPMVYRFDLALRGTAVSGTIGTGVRVVEVFEGNIDRDTIVFKIKSPDGGRTITFTGKLDGDAIEFTRDVVVLPGGSPGGAALYGAAGARNFVAKRVAQ